MKHGSRPDSKFSDAQAAGTDAFDLAAARLRAQRPLRNPLLRKMLSQLRNDRVEFAEKELCAYLASRPDDADALCLMSQAAARQGRLTEATSLLARCIELAPEFDSARFTYAKQLFRLHRHRAALDEANRLLIRDVRNPLFRRLKADILVAIGEGGPSLVISQELAAENPGRAESWLLYGHALRGVGNREAEAVAAYRKAIDCQPWFGLAWWGLANLKTVAFSSADTDAMKGQLLRRDLGPDDRIALQFSLGKAYADSGDYERSFEHYARANAALRLRVEDDRDALASRVCSSKDLFTVQFLRSRSEAGCKTADPIFVLGRPRSGSTLIEQILSSHPAIEGTGELPYIADFARRLEERARATQGIGYPQILETLEPAALSALGEEYLENARLHRLLGRPFFVDKMPRNFFHIGMIHLILPNAKIIDARRHPAACCLSIFQHYVATTNLRLTELGRVYRDYVELMAHFDRVLPGRIHRVVHEEVIANPEAEIRRLFVYLGLPFEERCLRFYDTERNIRTPSSEQVRRPISAEAMDRWRHYQRWIGPLIDSLGSVHSAYPVVPDELR